MCNAVSKEELIKENQALKQENEELRNQLIEKREVKNEEFIKKLLVHSIENEMTAEEVAVCIGQFINIYCSNEIIKKYNA